MITEMETTPGQHIDSAVQAAIDIASRTACPVQFVFNGAHVLVQPGERHRDIVTKWQSTMDRNAAEYRASPAGIKAAERAAVRLAQHQRDHDRLMQELPAAARDEAKLVQWCADFSVAADHSGIVGARFDDAADMLEAAGWRRDDCVGMDKMEFDRAPILARWIVGQAINCMRSGLPPHGVTQKFAEQYKGMRP